MKQLIKLYQSSLLFSIVSIPSITCFESVISITKRSIQNRSSNKFQLHVKNNQRPYHYLKKNTVLFNTNEKSATAYERQTGKDENNNKSRSNLPFPKIGDVVRYYDLDGGRADGEVLVGKISFIQASSNKRQFLIDVTQLEKLGNGYYTEYSSRQRQSRRVIRNLQELSPLQASYVRSEDAYKIPCDPNGNPQPYVESYNIEEYTGPIPQSINKEVVESDGERYSALKFQLLRDTALFGVIGALLVQLVRGTEDAIIYGLGSCASVGYLYFLSIKTDTVASNTAKFGNNISNLRFAFPLLVLVAVALRNVLDSGSQAEISTFSTVTSEQFASAMIGFLTYRIPLFLGQISSTASIGNLLPGSAAVALQVSNELKEDEKQSLLAVKEQQKQKTILLVSGPYCAGKSTLVQKLLQEYPDKFILPKPIDRIDNEAKFEILQRQDSILYSFDDLSKRKTATTFVTENSNIAPGARYAYTLDSILDSFPHESDTQETQEVALVLDANVDLTKKLLYKLNNSNNNNDIRVIGVWVSLDTMDKFQSRLEKEINSLQIPEDETFDSLIRARMKEIVKDIEYGIVSGIFEFTILNDDLEQSWKQFQNAAAYCFK